VLVFGVLGLISMFIPTEGMTLFSLFKLLGTGQLVIMLLAFGIPAVVGLIGLKNGIGRGPGIAAIVGFGLACWKMEIWHLGQALEGPLPMKLIALSAILGLVSAILVVAKPEQAAK
jgi:hypothetical protein